MDIYRVVQKARWLRVHAPPTASDLAVAREHHRHLRGGVDPRGLGKPAEGVDQRLEAVSGAALSFYTVVGGHWLPFLRDLHGNLVVVAVMFCPNDSVAPG
jgi:hypothetical protein